MPEVAKIVITMDEKTDILVVGSIENKIIAYGMLEVAKEVVRVYHEQQKQLIKPASDAERHLLSGNGPKRNM